MWRSSRFCGRLFGGPSSAIRRYATDKTLSGKTMAIRRETINLWERRAPLAPLHVKRLVDKGVKVLVQPSNRRAFTVEEYVQNGAIIQEDISEASLIIGVKAVPLDHGCLMPNKTYAFFSHTIKAQDENMPLLDALIERNVRLIDYEKMLDANGQRVVAFGQFAGYAGMIDILHGIGIRLLALGHHTPFMYIGPAHNYRSVAMAKQALRDAGYSISLGNMPRSIGPLVFVFTGTGNVSTGAQEIFYELPYELVQPEHLSDVFRSGDSRKVYGCVVSRSDHYQRRVGGGFDSDEFDEFPERYISTFSKKIAPYTSVLVNGIYWQPKAPRLITIPDAKTLLAPQKPSPWIQTSPGCPTLPHRLIAISDISCDPGGSIEFMKQITTIDKPFYVYDAEENVSDERFNGPGVLICSIDNMPAQLPREATEFFGSLLLPYIPEMLASDANTSFENYKVTPIVRDAVITSNGSLTPNFEYITDLRESLTKQRMMVQSAASKGSRSVLLFGSGYVAPPAIEYLLKSSDIRFTLASDSKTEVMKVADRFQNVTPAIIDLSRDPEAAEKLVASHDTIISLLPHRLHADVLKMALRHKKDFVTASYTTPEIEELAKAAEEQDISVVMEMGLDPGIDHMLAMETFDSVHAAGGKIISVRSFAGGLPAPECSDNPLRYKFSWSPEGVLLNVSKGARYLEEKMVKEIREGGELMLHAQKETVLPGFNLEGYPNRDSMPYTERYGLHDIESFTRGTYRYAGYSDVMYGLIQLGFVSEKPDPNLHPDGPEFSWKDFLASKMGLRRDVFTGTLQDAVFKHLGQSRTRFNAVEDLGLFSDQPIDKKSTPHLTFSHHLKNRLAYNEGERDIIIMINRVIVQWPDRSLEEKITRLVVYGDPNGTLAMGKTVGYPLAIAAKMVIEGEIQRSGLIMPMTKDIYRPMLKRLKQEGIAAVEVTHPVNAT